MNEPDTQPDFLTRARAETQRLFDVLNDPEPDISEIKDAWYACGQAVRSCVQMLAGQMPPDASLRGRGAAKKHEPT